MDFRLPRVLTALGLTGLLLQTTFRNPLADPWFLGLVHSARFGVALFVVLAGAGGASVLGSFGQLQPLTAVLIVGAASAALLSKRLDVLLLGDDYARSLGLAVNQTRMLAVGTAALMTGAVTAYCGPIAFLAFSRRTWRGRSSGPRPTARCCRRRCSSAP
jgi:ABC-type Fe3+-siderophore transport system permease subunit